MKRIAAMIMVVTMLLSVGSLTVSAAGIEDTGIMPRIMPVPFSFSDSVTLSPGVFPPGRANFYVTISGVYDINRDNVLEINNKTSSYTGGINCHDRDVEVVVWRASSESNIVYWKLEGTITFSWTSPVSGMQYERAFLSSPTYSFNADDYT